MPPPPAARGRTALGRLVEALRRRLRPDRGAPPATVPGVGSGEETALAAAARPQAEVAEPEVAEHDAVADATDAPARSETEPAPGDADARFDAARERLRARIEPPAPDDGD